MGTTFTNRRWLAPFVALALIALALPALTGVAGAQGPGIEGEAATDSVWGNGFAPNTAVDITVNGTLFDDAATTDGNGSFGVGLYDEYGVTLVLGDTIVASDGTSTKTLTLDGPLSIEVDEVGLTASGVAPAGGMITVWVGAADCETPGMPVVVDNTGTWSVDLSIPCPGGLGTFQWAQVNLSDGDGNASMATTPTPMCSNSVVTVDASRSESPTENADVIQGSEGDDMIDALGGNDLVCGLGGDDIINGGDGNDTLLGDAGDDTLDGGDGNDKLVGGDGNDTLLGQGGRDIIQGGNGNDVAEGGKKNDRISGNGGRDILNGGNGKDRIDGQAGPDTLIGGGGNDRLIGGGGVDTINGKVGNDFCIEGETVSLCEFDFIP